MSVFSDKLKELRKKTGKRQTALAELLGVAPRIVRFYESGQFEPNIERIIKIADFYDVSTDYLLGRSNDPKRH